MSNIKEPPQKISKILTNMLNNCKNDNSEIKAEVIRKSKPNNKHSNPDVLVENDIDEFKEESNQDVKIVKSSYDINLAEFPIAHLSNKIPIGIDKRKLTYEDKIKGRGGEEITRKWVVEGNSRYGLGGPSMLRLIYEIFQIWKEQGFEDKKIHIGSYYNLLKRLGRPRGGSNYKQLIKDLECIKGLNIAATNACYIPDTDDYLKHQDFKLFTKVMIYGKHATDVDPENDYVYIIADDEFYKSVKQKTIYHMPLHVDLVDSLKPQELKLALYLAKIFTPYKTPPRTHWKRNIYELADQIPINVKTVPLKDRSGKILKDEKGNEIIKKDRISILIILRRLCNSLKNNVQCHFLTDFKIRKDIINFYCTQTSFPIEPNIIGKIKKNRNHIEYLVNEMLKVCKDKQNIEWYYKIAINVPDSIIFPSLSEAKQEGKEPPKLFTKIIKDRASQYLVSK